VVATGNELAATKQNLAKEIERKINEKLNKSTSQTAANIHAKFPVETMVSEIYDAVHVEFQPEFELIEKHLKTCMHKIDLLQNRVNQLELKLDDIEQVGRNDSLLFNGVKQISSQSVRNAMKHVLFVKMGLTNVTDSDIVGVQRFSVGSNNDQRPDKVAPVLVQFQSKEIARHVFKAKKSLVAQGYL
jgi:BMFP domain-containing protein YqiC